MSVQSSPYDWQLPRHHPPPLPYSPSTPQRPRFPPFVLTLSHFSPYPQFLARVFRRRRRMKYCEVNSLSSVAEPKSVPEERVLGSLLSYGLFSSGH
ncbi:hypothetical protein MLD38_038407 [Melastoma candidum]|uniref:Uncharacterized protein n=1 Tax=Melastoma candidum TaxID=119954 RepID=A0ACB9KZE4_9MYRT|nr:hypothetical protein MLD38_038407 [Melastoma candidum]